MPGDTKDPTSTSSGSTMLPRSGQTAEEARAKERELFVKLAKIRQFPMEPDYQAPNSPKPEAEKA